MVGCNEIIGGAKMKQLLCGLKTTEVGTDQQIVYALKSRKKCSLKNNAKLDYTNSYGVNARAMEEVKEKRN